MQTVFNRAGSDGRRRAAMVALGVSGFAVGTGEFVMMGLVPEVAQSMGVDLPQAGRFISAYALGVVIGAPLLAVLTARCRRRTLLVSLLLLEMDWYGQKELM